MTRLIQFSNNAVSRLAANITNSATSLSLTSGEGSKFPSLSGSQFFMATLVKTDGTTEVVKVTARATDTLTIARAAESVGGVVTAYAFLAGDKVEARLTSVGLSGELDRLDAAALLGASNKSANYSVVAADISTLLRVNTASGTLTVTLPAISTLTDDFDTIIAKVSSDANTLNVVRSSTDTINGATSYTLYTQFQSVWLIADRTTNTWTAVTAANSGANVVVDAFTGAGTAGPFTLSGDPVSKNNTVVIVGGTPQLKSTYSLSGTALTLGGVVTAGVLIEVWWTQPLVIGVPSDGSVSTVKIADLGVTTAKVADSAVTYAKMQSVTAGKLLGRDTSGNGLVQELPISVDASGNVGFGVTTPSARIDSKSTSGFSAPPLNCSDGTGSMKIAFNASTYAGVPANKPWIHSSQDIYIGSDTAINTTIMSGGAAVGAFLSDGNFKMNSGYGSNAVAYACRAWVNFNGAGTVAIRASGNVSSITDNGVGSYTINFTTALPDANYSTSMSGGNGSGTGETYVNEAFGGSYIKTSSAYRISVYSYNTTSGADRDQVNVAFFR